MMREQSIAAYKISTSLMLVTVVSVYYKLFYWHLWEGICALELSDNQPDKAGTNKLAETEKCLTKLRLT